MSAAAAIAAAERGYAVFPLVPGRKEPAVKDWPNRACSDPQRVARHWPGQSGLGIACGPSGLVVLDLDAHGDLPEDWRLPGVNDGKDVFAWICEAAGMDWPQTYTVATPSGGWHLYFTAPENSTIRNSASMIGPQVDVRADGGYVVGAGTVTSAGTYDVLYDEPVEPLPPWITRLLSPPPPEKADRPAFSGDVSKRLTGIVRVVETAPAGRRTSKLVWAAFQLKDMIGAGEASEPDGELLIQAAVYAGIDGGERYARGQVTSVLRRASR